MYGERMSFCSIFFYLCSRQVLTLFWPMKRYSLLLLSLLVCCPLGLRAQLTLDECRRQARDNYPLIRQYGLIEKAVQYNVDNAAKAYLPQVSLSAKASYQSDATRLPFELPGIDVNFMPKDQYQVVLQVQQSVWDGGETKWRKRLARAGAEVDTEKLNVDLYALDERVNQLFFGILLLDEQLQQNNLLMEDLGRAHRTVSACVENGTANRSDLDEIAVEQLGTRQQRVALETTRRAYADMLSLYLGLASDEELKLEKPVATEPETGLNNRPELRWYDAQTARLAMQDASLKAGLMPRFGIFLQGGYGNPGLNMLQDKFKAYYVAGVSLSWNLAKLYTRKNDSRLIENGRLMLEAGRSTFLFNTGLEATRQEADVQALRRQMEDDDEIIRLRTRIRQASEVKLQNGTQTVNDLLRDITAENLARLQKSVHEVQLLMKLHDWKHTLNN